MAEITSTAIAAGLAQEYPEVFSTVFRQFVAAQFIPTRPGSGKNDSFDVRFRSTQAARNATEGQDVTTYINDTFVPATGVWAEYDAAIKITGLANAIARSSGGTASEVKELRREALVAAYAELAVLLRADFYSGVSTSPQSLIGLYGGTTIGALGSTGTYYNINRGGAAPLPNWAGNVLRNGGVKRKLMPKHIDQALTAVVDARGTMPNVMLANSALCDSLRETLNVQYVQEISTGGAPIRLSAGYRAINYQGIPIVRDPSCTANVLFGLDTSQISFRQLTQESDPFVQATMQALQAQGTVDMPGGGIPFTVMVSPISRGGDYARSLVTWKGQLRVHDPASHFVLADVE